MIAEAALAAALNTFFAPYAERGALSVAVIREGRAVVRTYGAPPGAVFRMASLSKVVTALAVVRSGHNLHVPTRYGVTLHHLLTHTSGIDDAFFGNTAPIESPITLAEHFTRRPPRFGRPAGREVVYSNEGLALAGHLIEDSRPFEQIVAETVFAPLGMTRSTFAQPPPWPVIPSGSEKERLIQTPAGAMTGTAEDMAKLLAFLLSDDPATVIMRHNRYGLFQHENAFFHTGRSGHESVLYLDPAKRLGLFLVHTGGLDRDLRKRFVREFGGWRAPAPRAVQITAGTYRPILFPLHRIERLANLGADTSVRAAGSTVTVRLPPLAAGETLVFTNGVTADGFVLNSNGGRFTISGPLFEPITFEPVRVSGRLQLLLALAAWIILASAAFTRGGRLFAVVALLFALAPVAFFANYLPRSAEARPFHVEMSVKLGVATLAVAAAFAMATPLVARRAHHVIAAVCAASLGVWVLWWIA